jgi:signal transduction histidine kinase
LLEHEEVITAPLKLAIFRIIQEQLNNIVKHARATKIAIRIVQFDNQVKVYVRDNGIGFDPQKGPRGLGLRNISSRANLFRGQVEINSQVGHGTELQVFFPLRG